MRNLPATCLIIEIQSSALMRNLLPTSRNPARKRSHDYFIADIMIQILSAFVALSRFVLSVDFNFYHYLFGVDFVDFDF